MFKILIKSLAPEPVQTEGIEEQKAALKGIVIKISKLLSLSFKNTLSRPKKKSKLKNNAVVTVDKDANDSTSLTRNSSVIVGSPPRCRKNSTEPNNNSTNDITAAIPFAEAMTPRKGSKSKVRKVVDTIGDPIPTDVSLSRGAANSVSRNNEHHTIISPVGTTLDSPLHSSGSLCI